MAAQITSDMNDEQVREILESVDVGDRNALKECLMDASPRQVFCLAMPYAMSMQPDITSRMEGIEGAVLWVIEGEGGGTFAMSFGSDGFNVREGEADARATVKLGMDTWKELSSGKSNPQMAFMQGKMTVTGDMSFLMQLQGVMPQM